MNKRGYGVLVIVIVAIIVIALLVVGVGIGSTGKATLEQKTDGASYGNEEPIYGGTENCRYTGGDDGWSVTRRQEVIYRSLIRENEVKETDYCIHDGAVKEYHCENGHLKIRSVRCPIGTVCEQGACVK